MNCAGSAGSLQASLQAVGLVLVIALLIAPDAIALLRVRSFGRMLVTAVAIALGCALSGVYLSFFLGSAPAPTIVLLLGLVFVLALLCRFRSSPAARAGYCQPPGDPPPS